MTKPRRLIQESDHAVWRIFRIGRRDDLGAAAAARTRAVSVTLISLVYVATLAASTLVLVSPPRLTVMLAAQRTGPVRVAGVLPGGTLWQRGVRAGDRVLALDDQAPGLAVPHTWHGAAARIRTGTGIVTITAASVPSGHDSWPLLLVSPWFLLLGTLVLLRAPDPAVGRATYALFACGAFALALATGADHDDPVSAVVEFGLASLCAALFVRFFLAFPTPRRTGWLGAAVLVPPVLLTLLNLAALVWPGLYDPAAELRIGVILTFLLLGAGIAVWSFVATREREQRRGLAIVSGGAVLAVLPFIALYLAPTLLGRPTLLASEHAILAMAILPLSFAYAILRHQVLPIQLLQRWLVHLLLWSALLVPFALILLARHILLTGLPEPGRTVALEATLAGLAAVFFGWGRARLQRRLDQLIFKDAYDYRPALQALSHDVSVAHDLVALGQSLPATLRRLMNLDFAVLLISDAGRVTSRGGTGSYAPDLLPALGEAVRDVREKPCVVTLGFGYLDVLAAPLRTHDALVGHLCLGPKVSGEPFRAEDRALLATLSGHLAAIVRNAQLVDDLRAKVAALDALNARLAQVQEEERHRLAADLHDEPLQTALALQRELAATAAPPALIERGRLLVAQLRALCLTMRPPALDDLGLLAALDHLARDLGTRTGIPIVLDADPEIRDLELAPQAEVVLYRAAQEALANVRRHARARAVRITAYPHGNGVRLCVSDDGVGFTAPARLDRLVLEGHLGLAGLAERVRHAGGRLSVISAPREGTTVQIDLPRSDVQAPV